MAAEAPQAQDSHSGLPPGLRNSGNLCFLNAALQALAALPPLVPYLSTLAPLPPLPGLTSAGAGGVAVGETLAQPQQTPHAPQLPRRLLAQSKTPASFSKAAA